MEGKTILLILVFLILLMKYVKKEGFTSEAKLTEYLNTWQATNNEIRNIFETAEDKIRIKKPIVETANVRADNDLSAPHIYGNKFVLGKRVYAEDGIKIGFSGTPEKQDQDWQGVIHKGDNGMDLSGFGNPKKVRIYDELCIKGTCINEDHLKMLKGEKEFKIQNTHWGRWMSCMGKSGDGSSSGEMKDGYTCMTRTADDSNHSSDATKKNSHRFKMFLL